MVRPARQGGRRSGGTMARLSSGQVRGETAARLAPQAPGAPAGCPPARAFPRFTGEDRGCGEALVHPRARNPPGSPDPPRKYRAKRGETGRAGPGQGRAGPGRGSPAQGRAGGCPAGPPGVMRQRLFAPDWRSADLAIVSRPPGRHGTAGAAGAAPPDLALRIRPGAPASLRRACRPRDPISTSSPWLAPVPGWAGPGHAAACG